MRAEFLVTKEPNGSNNPDNEGSHGPGNARREARENPGVSQLCDQQLGYMRKRGDFENEYDYELDEVLAELEYFSDDNDEDIEYKDKMINYYLKRQEERMERKQFVIERGLLDIKKPPAKGV